MKNIISHIIIVLACISGLFAVVHPAYGTSTTANTAVDQLNISGKGAYGQQAAPLDIRFVVIKIILYVFTFAGTIFVALVVYAGYSLLTSNGEQEKVEKAYHTIRVAVIGLILSLTAYSLAYFIGNALMTTISTVDPAFLN